MGGLEGIAELKPDIAAEDRWSVDILAL